MIRAILNRPAGSALLVISTMLAFQVVNVIGNVPKECNLDPFTVWDALKTLGFIAVIGLFAFDAGREQGRVRRGQRPAESTPP